MSESESGPVGQINGGSTCWANAWYQALLSIKPLMTELKNAYDKFPSDLRDEARESIDVTMGKLFNRKHLQQSQSKLARALSGFPGGKDMEEISEKDTKGAVISTRFEHRGFMLDISHLRTDTEFTQYHAVPCITCALIVDMWNAFPSDEAGLRFYCALAIQFARYSNTKNILYKRSGDASTALLNIIIECLVNEIGTGVANLFEMEGYSMCLCYACAQKLYEQKDGDTQSQTAYRKLTTARNLAVIPITNAIPHQATYTFASRMQTWVTTCDSTCYDCKEQTGVVEITDYTKFGKVIAVGVDDANVRAQQNVEEQSVARIGTIRDIPSMVQLRSRGMFANYELTAEIVQVGNHITTTCMRGNTYYISDGVVKSQGYSPSMQKIHQGALVLLYTFSGFLPLSEKPRYPNPMHVSAVIYKFWADLYGKQPATSSNLSQTEYTASMPHSVNFKPVQPPTWIEFYSALLKVQCLDKKHSKIDDNLVKILAELAFSINEAQIVLRFEWNATQRNFLKALHNSHREKMEELRKKYTSAKEEQRGIFYKSLTTPK